VLVAARRAAGDGVAAEEIVDFLEASFGAFQEVQRNGAWRWSRNDLSAALDDLARHELVEPQADGRFCLTSLGRLAGEGLCEVSSIVRLVDCLRPIAPEDISDPALITAVQTTAELDRVLFPINKKSTQKEPQTWAQELRRQGVTDFLLGSLRQGTTEPHVATLRAKKAVACLLYVSGGPMDEIEHVLTQFGGAFGGAAGPIRGVASRTCDLLSTAVRIAEFLHPGLDMSERSGRLALRLELGITGLAVDLARQTGARLSRGDYRRLAAAALAAPDQIDAAEDASLLACLDGDRAKLGLVRESTKATRERERRMAAQKTPILEAYEP